MALSLVPLTLRKANAFIKEHHRHHKPARGCICVVGVTDEAGLVGVAIIDRTVARMATDGWTAEVTRVCTTGASNACSMLYGAAWRAVRALGYRRLITYTLLEEGGASLRGAGWKCLGEAGGGSWNRKSRPRNDQHPTQRKLKWQMESNLPN